MKMKNFVIVTLISGIGLFSCDNTRKDTVTETTVPAPIDTVASDAATITTIAQQATRDGNGIVIKNDEVPDTIRTSFTTKYPRVKKSEWYRYQPVEEDEMKMDDSYYYVRFNDNGADYTTWYNNRGEWVKTATKVPGNKNLPDAVNKYINVNYPGYTIEEISKENDKDMDMYEIKMNKGDSKVKLKILPNGKVFKRKRN
ncbi:MAG: PepSY-like domain-containing protein [Ferruginibacter sp.]